MIASYEDVKRAKDGDKYAEMLELYWRSSNELVQLFFDPASTDRIADKIDMLKKLKDGVPISDINDAYSLLEKYPKSTKDRRVIWR